MRPNRIAGVVLAAGQGTRMGRTKQELPILGRTVLERVVDAALASSLDRTVVVLGWQAVRLARCLRGRKATLIINRDFEAGQSSSIRCGLREVKKEAEAVLFLLGDQPLLRPATIDRILSAYRSDPHPIVQPIFEGRRGNPVLFGRETFPRLEALVGDGGARGLFGEYHDRILRVPVEDDAIHFDIDTPEDYRRLLRTAAERDLAGSGRAGRIPGDAPGGGT